MEKFTFVIAVFSVIYSVVTTGLYEIARDSLVVGQKAFVYATNASIIGDSPNPSVPRSPGTKLLVAVTFKNSGQTLARRSTSTMNYLLTEGGIPNDFTYPVGPASQPVLLAPQIESNLSKDISDKDLEAVKKGKLNLFVYGDTSYVDVFGTQHRTEHCFQYFGYTTKPNGDLGGMCPRDRWRWATVPSILRHLLLSSYSLLI